MSLCTCDLYTEENQYRGSTDCFVHGASEKARIKVETLTRELDEYKEKYEKSKRVLKELCDEWQEGCEPNCTSYGHDVECRAIDLTVAKRALNQKVTLLEKQNKHYAEILSEVVVNFAQIEAHTRANGLDRIANESRSYRHELADALKDIREMKNDK